MLVAVVGRDDGASAKYVTQTISEPCKPMDAVTVSCEVTTVSPTVVITSSSVKFLRASDVDHPMIGAQFPL